MTGKKILELSMGPNDAGAETVRGYLIALLRSVWENGEGFSGKRPFGNSGWQYDLYGALIQGGAIEGTLDEDGYAEDFDQTLADAAIFKAIAAL